MSKLSLRWRITFLMGILVFCSSVLLTLLSVHNATQNFMIPLTYVSTPIEEGSSTGDIQDHTTFSFDDVPSNLPGGTFFKEEIRADLEGARQAFSLSGILYLIVITIGSMGGAYYLSGQAMRPISKLKNEIEQIDKNSLSFRVSVPQTNDEIKALSLSFNKLLEHFEQEYEREKRFSANMAHELKTPLATIIASAQVLKLDTCPTQQEYKENLDLTLQNAKRISSVVENLLLLHRAKRELYTSQIALNILFSEIQENMKNIYPEKNIQITYDLDIQYIIGNRPFIYQACFNLLDNAYKYTLQNGIIHISSYKEKNSIVLCISDDGIGISKDDIEHIFEPFYRGDKSRSSKISGSGLGLSISKEIFELHNANISFDSVPNKGTTIKISAKAESADWRNRKRIP